MKVLFRADASVALGSGHIMRCLTLAQALVRKGAECHFICRELPGNLVSVIRQQGFLVMLLPNNIKNEKADAMHTIQQLSSEYQLLVVDHYQLGELYCTLLRTYCQYIMVIDDLADRHHNCDILLDQNLLPDAKKRYDDLLPQHTIQLLGPRYALLRDEFYHTAPATIPRHILISFGGSDEANLTTMALQAIKALKSPPVTADIVIGANNPWQPMLVERVSQMPNVRLHIQTSAMASLMAKAELMLGAGGATHWERCISKLPGLIVTVAENQVSTTAYLQKLGACVWLGNAAAMSVAYFTEQLSYYLSRPARLKTISNAAEALLPHSAGTPLVVEQILNVLMRTEC